MKDKIKVIEPEQSVPVQQKIIKKSFDKYNYYCLVIFILFILMTFIISIINLNDWIKFSVIIFGTFVLEDIHHTLKKLWAN